MRFKATHVKHHEYGYHYAEDADAPDGCEPGGPLVIIHRDDFLKMVVALHKQAVNHGPKMLPWEDADGMVTSWEFWDPVEEGVTEYIDAAQALGLL